MTLDIKRTRDFLQAFDFKALFNELGWDQPKNTKTEQSTTQDQSYTRREIAELAGVAVFEIVMSDEKIPDAKTRRVVYKEISSLSRENLLIFLDSQRTQSLWYWIKHDGNRSEPRDHLYVRGQPGDLSLGKLEKMLFDVSDFDQSGNISVIEVANRLQSALDIEHVTKRFYEDFKAEHQRFLDTITGIDDDRDRRWYASVILNRLMFIYFLQRKWFIDDGNSHYLQDKLAESTQRCTDTYYSEFLHLLFFEGFAKPPEERSEAAQSLLGKIVYLNGGLFLPHPVEKRWPAIQIPDQAFKDLFALFSHYSWNLDDTPGGLDNEISPHVLGYIFEKYINQKSYGAYYTRPEITEYLCDHTIHTLILERINLSGIPGIRQGRHFDSIEEMLMNLDTRLCRDLLAMLPKISLLDPACGSGAFLVSAMNTLMKIYGAITGKIEYLHDNYLTDWLKQARTEHDSLNYYIKKKIITENLFGVDIMEEATEIAKLRLFLALVSSVNSVDQLEPLPNIDFNILPGNSLIGFLQVNEAVFNTHPTQLNLFQRRYQELVEEKNSLIQEYKNTRRYMKDLRVLRDTIQMHRDDATLNLNELLLDDFKQLGVKYEQATWDSQKQAEGKSKKRALNLKDIATLHPFHWGYEFDRVMNEQGGFDIIITNPPWETLKPQAKEFFATHSKLVSINKMRIEEFETERTKLLQDDAVRAEWLDYQNSFPYQSVYFRAAPQYTNQVSTVNGKRSGSDINLYKLFTEQCYNLLREGGQCGIVVPSGIYTDLGTKQLREMLFKQTQITGMFCFENRKTIFEGVDSRFKFAVLTFEKGRHTQTFPAAFMRHEATELERFPRYGALHLSVDLIQRLSPDSLSIMEFKNDVDIRIAQKMQKFPQLGENLAHTWNFVLGNEFHMTNSSHLFKTHPAAGYLPLYEGKMIHQFTHTLKPPRYWISEQEGRNAIIGRNTDTQQVLNYQKYRLGHRAIARSTDERTMIATIFPPDVFFGHSINATRNELSAQELLFVTALLNSLVVDFLLRQRVSANLTMFYIYQLPVPRLTEEDAVFNMVTERAAQLICTTPEFQQLWETAMTDSLWLTAHTATTMTQRAKLRAELDGLIAHIYELSEEEFCHMLAAFPLVDSSIKTAAVNAYRKFALAPADLQLLELVAKGETDKVEFKEAACWNTRTQKKDDL